MTQCYTLNNIWFAYEISQLQTLRRESSSKIVLFSSGVTFDNSDTGCQIFLNMAHNQLPWWSHNNYSHSSKSLSMLSVNVDFLCWQILTLILVSPCWMLTFSSVSFTVSIPRILETWQHSDCKIKKKIISWIFSLVDLLDRHFIGHLSPTKITLNTQHIQIIKSKIYSIKSTVYFEILCHMRLALLAAST